MNTVAFFSYSRHDDQAVDGLLSKIRSKLEVEVRVRSGDEDLQVFQDTDDIDMGDDWRSVLREAIDSSVVFIPVVTPFYFTRPACREELNIWLSNYRTPEERKRIIPIKFLPIRTKSGNGAQNDNLRIELEKIQYLDFQPYRFNSTLRGKISKDISALADKILSLMPD
ncbi:toll/interleukin-1 receptor domain-containing protein [Roseospira visakhapatnamensis]|uniref:TIR domain-containing protein n=1 Tax=Roseospira visakhapatnamensis TaxID=390880 RepID=A0A7W6RGE3_9PROT|nr:toll/interleukin-1 receptor domain-containing protein [Roseospira visakhapatnamensis]MBB4267837.1 hypothetical protein [Roseospira visakhapatnamensis]